MKKPLKIFLTLVIAICIIVLTMILLMPWMDRWGATDEEIAASFPGDELLLAPRIVYNHTVTIHATPEQIYPWIVQLGAEKGGMLLGIKERAEGMNK